MGWSPLLPITHCCSVVKSYPTLQTHALQHSRLPVLHCLSEFAQTHVHWVNDTIQPSNPIPFSSYPQSFPVIRVFSNSQLFASGSQSTGTLALASVLPVKTQGLFPLELTGLISLQSKGLPRVFSSTMVWEYQFFDTQPSLWPNSHIPTRIMEKPLTRQTFVCKVMSLL